MSERAINNDVAMPKLTGKVTFFPFPYAVTILPPRMMRVRYYGLFAHRFCKENMAKCRLLLGLTAI